MRAPHSAIEDSLGLAVTASLASISHELWPQHERSGPLLALERFEDLTGRVGFEERTVRVHLPLGQRFFDLRDSGLLENLDGVPWLGGRVVCFEGG